MSAFMEECRSVMRTRHLAYRTEKSYLHWIKRFILFNQKEHPSKMGDAEVVRFLSYIASDRQCSPSTQTQALCALAFMYKHVIAKPLGKLQGIAFAKKRIRPPEILSQEEVNNILSELKGVDKLIVQLLYGSGLRLHEALSLRIKDIDFTNACITVRMAKGSKDRVVTLAASIVTSLRQQIDAALDIHKNDVSNGLGFAPAPYALRRKLGTTLQSPGWQYIFPSTRLCGIPDTGELVRYHRYPDNIRRSLSKACKRCNIVRRVTCHTFRHTFGRRLRAAGVSFEDRQDLLGHRSGRITTHYSAAELSRLLEAANSVCREGGGSSNSEIVVLRRISTS